MSIYKKNTMVGGAWAKAIELSGVKRAKIVSETNTQPSTFTNKDGSPKTQDVCKVQFEGKPEALNVSLNRATINGLVDAFGEDSKGWQGHVLSVETEKVRVAGKAVVALYLIPAGFKKVDDAEGYAMIVNEKEIEKAAVPDELPVINFEEEGDIKPEDIPF